MQHQIEPAQEVTGKNLDILRARSESFNTMKGPRVGDFCVLLDGSWRRFTYDWGNTIQVTPKDHLGSFYLGIRGADFSGSLEQGIDKNKFKLSQSRRLGAFWFFDQGIPGAGRGVNVQVVCNVYREVSA